MASPTRKGQVVVVGAGLPRTGTLSIMAALEILLNGKCCHGMKMWQHEKDICDIMYGNYDTARLQNFFQKNNFVAAVDAPLCFHYESVMKAFPEAKVILSVRDDPACWYRSISFFLTYTTGCPIIFLDYILKHFPGLWKYYHAIGPRDDLLDALPSQRKALFDNPDTLAEMFVAIAKEDAAADFYNKWNKRVEETVPRDKLLRFNVKEGWEPLCLFLGIPVPKVPFPRLNYSGDIQRRIEKMKRRSWLMLYEMVSVPTLLTFVVCNTWKVDIVSSIGKLMASSRLGTSS